MIVESELLRLESITSCTHGHKTLDGFCMSLYQGEILGVFSHHLVVKNDLIDLIVGRKGAQFGRLYIDGEPCPFEEVDPQRLRKAGVIRAVTTLIKDFSVAENIFVVRRGLQTQIVDRKLIRAQSQQLMEEYELPITPDSLVRNLSTVERCSLEIVKAIALGARVVILQDLSGFLADLEIERLLRLVSRLKRNGLGFLMVDSSDSHLLRYTDRTIVIKGGRNYWDFKRGVATEALIGSCFAGNTPAIAATETVHSPNEPSDQVPVLVFDHVQSGVLEPLSFTLHRGEELYIVDQSGKSIDEVRALLSGERKPSAGIILASGKPYRAKNLWEALNQKVAFVVENPTETMLFPDLTAIENLCFPTSRKTRYFWMNPVYMASCMREYESYFDEGVLKRYPDELSNEDLQKLIYCRWHLYNPKAVVCIKPFSSVEKSLEEISAFFIGLMLKKGIAVLILASNASETRGQAREIRLGSSPHKSASHSGFPL